MADGGYYWFGSIIWRVECCFGHCLVCYRLATGGRPLLLTISGAWLGRKITEARRERSRPRKKSKKRRRRMKKGWWRRGRRRKVDDWVWSLIRASYGTIVLSSILSLLCGFFLIWWDSSRFLDSPRVWLRFFGVAENSLRLLSIITDSLEIISSFFGVASKMLMNCGLKLVKLLQDSFVLRWIISWMILWRIEMNRWTTRRLSWYYDRFQDQIEFWNYLSKDPRNDGMNNWISTMTDQFNLFSTVQRRMKFECEHDSRIRQLVKLPSAFI